MAIEIIKIQHLYCNVMQFTLPDLIDPDAHPKSVQRDIARQRDEIREAFRAHNERIRPHLPDSLKQLQDISLHDARIYRLQALPEAASLEIGLIYGDSVKGYFDLSLRYSAISLTPLETSLLYLIAYAPGAEIDWGEIDICESDGLPIYIHRVIWNTAIQIQTWPLDEHTTYVETLCPEVELRFGGLHLITELCPDGAERYHNVRLREY